MEERRKINRIEFQANSVIVNRDTLEKVYGQVKNISPLGIAITVKGDRSKEKRLTAAKSAMMKTEIF